MASRGKKLSGARLGAEVSRAPFASGGVLAGGVLAGILALAAPFLSSCDKLFEGPFDKALDAMGAAFEEGSFGRCVTKAPTSEWKIRTPDGEKIFPGLRTESMLTAYSRGAENCIPEESLKSLKAEFEGIKATLKHCPKNACTVVWPLQQTLSVEPRQP